MSTSTSKVQNPTTIKKRPRPLRLTDAKRAQIFQYVLESPHLTQKAVAEKFQVSKNLVAKLIKDGKELRMAAPPVSPAKIINPSTDSALDLPAPNFGQLRSPIPGFGQLQSPLTGLGQLQTPHTEFDPMPTPHSAFGPMPTPHSAFGLMPTSHSGVLQPSPVLPALDPCICHLIPDALWDEIAAYGNAYTETCTGKYQLNEPMDISGMSPAPAFFQPLRKEVVPADADETEDEQDPCATQTEPY